MLNRCSSLTISPSFLDYIAIETLEAEKVAQIVKGVAGACKESGCALIGGETAEMSDLYGKDEYDIAGFCVGVVEKSKMITRYRRLLRWRC